jgi:hypothetical protein
MSLVVDEMALDELAVNEMAVDDLTPHQCLHYGINCSKLGSFLNVENIFCASKGTNR